MYQERIMAAINYLTDVQSLLMELKFRFGELSGNGKISETVENYLNSVADATHHVDLKLNSDNAKKRLTFTKKEIEKMPTKYKNIFACRDNIVTYRQKPNGVYEARFHRDGIHIEVSSKDVLVMRQKFLKALEKYEEKEQQKTSFPKKILFNDCVDSWLQIKRRTTKPSTFEEYERISEKDIKPFFYNKYAQDITRAVVQDYLFSYTDQGKHRTAEKILLIIRCVFDLASDDYKIESPVNRVVLPFRETKKGVALTLEEEKRLVEHCLSKPNEVASSALLVLLYFGLRKSELKTISATSEALTCISSKTLLGKNEVHRVIPFTPVFKRILAHVDFEKARNANLSSIDTTFKKLLPTHHPHELRYTFITRCKECGVNPEIVMLWDGHEEDKDVRASKVDRGYTDFSWRYQLEQAKKVDYDL